MLLSKPCVICNMAEDGGRGGGTVYSEPCFFAVLFGSFVLVFVCLLVISLFVALIVCFSLCVRLSVCLFVC